MVHGSFALKSGTLQINPENGNADGSIVVNALSGKSDNTSRDQRMHKEILETWKFPDSTFRPRMVEGKLALSGPSDVKLYGILSLHGSDHDLTVPVHVELNGDHWKGTCKFDIPYIQWGIKDPSNFLLKVKPVVQVELEMAGTERVGD
jgi:polyisoprenoid-binding protein YceI